MYYKRNIEQAIEIASKSFSCITIYGARQVGKSTTVRHIFGNKLEIVSLDDYEQLYLAKTNPKLFLQAHPWPLIIDEIQKAPELLPEIKICIDNFKFKCLEEGSKPSLMFILTGSNQIELQKATVESLAGRTAVLYMNSMSLNEKEQREGSLFSPILDVLKEKERRIGFNSKNRIQIFDEIFKGGMPELVSSDIDRQMYYKSYVDTYIEKDVKLLISNSSEFLFRNFLSIVALRTAQEVNWDEISRSVGIDVKTCKRWMSILETSGIVYLLQPYMKNASTRIIKSPKLYFMDTGLCSYLCKWPTSEMLEKGIMAGAFFETFVVTEIVKSFNSLGKTLDCLYYFRTMGQKEIDLIYEENNTIYPIEIKKGIAPSNPAKNFSALAIFKKTIGTGLIIDSCERIMPLNNTVWFCPVSLL